MDEIDLLVDLHLKAYRQGPGGDAETKLTVLMSGLAGRKNLKIADIGCGTGASAMVLAEYLDADIVAVDFLPAFLEKLKTRAESEGVDDRIVTQTWSMSSLKFEQSSLDGIWSEGAIYNMGFEKGIRYWRKFLKTGGILAVSELTWLTNMRSSELNDYWTKIYPEVGTASTKISKLESNGYKVIGYFPLSKACWLDHYYLPMQNRFNNFLEQHNYSDTARSIVESERKEIDIYKQYSDYYSYGYYVAQKVSGSK